MPRGSIYVSQLRGFSGPSHSGNACWDVDVACWSFVFSTRNESYFLQTREEKGHSYSHQQQVQKTETYIEIFRLRYCMLHSWWHLPHYSYYLLTYFSQIDNAKQLTGHFTKAWLMNKRFLEWPAVSPDLFPIENVCSECVLNKCKHCCVLFLYTFSISS